MVVPYVWILDASDAPWMLQTLQNLALARLWSLGSARIRRSKTSHLPDCGLWALRDCGRSCTGSSGLCETVGGVAQAVGSGRWRAGAASLWILDASDAPKPRACQTVGSGLCETVGGVAQAVGSGLWRAKSFFSSGPKLPFKRLKPLKPLKRSDTCQWLTPYVWILDASDAPWMLQTLQNLDTCTC